MSAARPLLRIARRALLRDRVRALLVIMLIALPISGMIAAAALLGSAFATPEERATEGLGRADLAVVAAAHTDGMELIERLPRGSVVEPVLRSTDHARGSGTRPKVDLRYVDVNGLAAGQLSLLDGRTPASASEAAISTHLSRLIDVSVGGALELESSGKLLVVGLVEDPRGLLRDIVLRPPAAATDPDLTPAWLVELPDGAKAERVARRLEEWTPAGGELASTISVYTRRDFQDGPEMLLAAILLLGMLALVEAALVAAAAFAVGIRRRQRELGLLGATGASRSQLAGSVLAEGLMAGAVAVVVGVVLGTGLAWLVGTRLDDIVNARTGGMHIEVSMVVLASAVGLSAALIAAALPAWGAAREATLVALSGRRPPATPARRLLVVGMALIVLCLVCTIGVPLASAAMRGAMYWPILFVLLLGAVSGVLGIGACSPWLLERLEPVSGRLPLPARIAFRDTARARTRNGPIVTAILASVAAAIAVAAIAGSSQLHTERRWDPPTDADTLVIRGLAAERVGERIADELGATDRRTGMPATPSDGWPTEPTVLIQLDRAVRADDMDRAVRIAATDGGDAYVEGPLPPPDPMAGFRLFVLAIAMAAAITVTAVAVALGEIESRPEQRTLVVLGAERDLRRRITAARGSVIAVLAGLLAIPAGLLPVIGLLTLAGWEIVLPLPEMVAAIVVLPLVATLGGLLLGRPLPDWDVRAEPRS